MEQNVLWGASLYIMIGAVVWMQIAFDNHMEMKVNQCLKYKPVKLLKTAVFWLPYLLFGLPSAKWMVK